LDRSRRNILVGWTHEALWGVGFGFLQPMTILPLALTDLGGSAAQAGLLAGLLAAGMNLLQGPAALALSPAWTEPRRLALLHLPAILGTYATAAVFFLRPEDPQLHRALFLAGCTWFFLGVGLTVPQWMVATSRCIGEGFRGRYFGVSFFLSGFLQVLTSGLAARWASQGGLEWGYGTAFLLAAVFQTLSALGICLWRPLRPAPAARRGPAGPFLKGLLTDRERTAWGLFAALSALLVAMNAAGGLFTVDLRDARGADKTLFELLAPVFSLGLMAGAIVMGWVSDRRGPDAALKGAVAAALASLAGVAFLPVGWVQALSYFGSGYANHLFVACMVAALALSGARHPTVKIGWLNTLLTPVQFGAPFLAGHLAERLGYGAAYGFSAAAAVAAALLLRPNALWRTLRDGKSRATA
jgi:MFS family permease